jgi:hypothetical protein
VLQEAAASMPDQVGPLTVAYLEDRPPRWAKDLAEQLDQARKRRLQSGRRRRQGPRREAA